MSIDERSQHTGNDNARFVQDLQSEGPRREVLGRWFLKPVGKRPGLPQYLTDLYNRRHFIWADSRARAFSAGRGMILGNAWLVLQPMLNGAIYLLIFGFLLQASRGVDNYMGYLIVGVFLFQYTSRCMQNGASAITSSRAMIRGFSFPRAALPISIVLREAINMLPVVGTMAFLIIVVPPLEALQAARAGEEGALLPPHAEISWLWLIFPAVFVLQTLFNLGIAFFVARLVAQIPDVRFLLQFVRRLLFYGSAVLFTFERFVSDPDIIAILQLNPVFIVLDMSRDLLVYGVTPAPGSWLMLTGWAVGILTLGFLYFWRAEERYGRE